MGDLLHRLRGFIASHQSRKFRILVTLLIVAAIPLTVYVAQKVQEVRQRASNDCEDRGYGWAESEFQCGGDAHYNCDNIADDVYANNHKVYVHKYAAPDGTYYLTEDQGAPGGVCGNQCSVNESNGPCDTGSGVGTWWCKYDEDQGNYWECRDVVAYTPVPAQPTVRQKPNCNVDIDCPGHDNCNAPSNTCGNNNGKRQGCFYRGHTADGGDCNPVAVPDGAIPRCTVDNCSDNNVCSNGSCVAPTTAPQATAVPGGGQGGSQSVTCWICDCGQKRSQNRSGSCQAGEMTTDPGTCPAAGAGCVAATSTPVVAATAVPTTVTANAGTLAVKIPLQSIGSGNPTGPQRNSNPQRRTRDVIVSLYTANNTPTGLQPVTATLTYDTTEQLFKGNINLTNMPAGTYRLRVGIKGSLDRRSAAVALPSTSPLTFVELLMCNIADSDDTIDIQDYSLFTSCFEGKANSAACGSFKQTADCNDDGSVTLEDYVWLFKNLGQQDE